MRNKLSFPKPGNNRFWLILFACVMAILAAVCLFLFHSESEGTIAIITLDGEVVKKIDLSSVSGSLEWSFTGKGGITDVVCAEEGRICVKSANCPDLTCVHQGWIFNGTFPIVCLPNQLVIRVVEPGAPDADGKSG